MIYNLFRLFRIILEAFPDHSLFSKFRKRLTKGKFDLIVGDILNQFADQRLKINEGIAIDDRVVKSASRLRE
jgi:intein/homing endonuclease